MLLLLPLFIQTFHVFRAQVEKAYFLLVLG